MRQRWTVLNDTPGHQPSNRAVREKRIYLLRHGQIGDAASPRRYIGQTDLPLTEEGQYQARELAVYFSKTSLAKIVCSDLQRSLQTARIIAEKHPVKVETLSAFREVNLGEWEGLTFHAVKAEAPAEWRLRGKKLADHRPPGAESFRDLHHRVVPMFETLAKETQGDLMIVGHAGVNRVILCHLLEMPLQRMFCLSQDYAAVNVILLSERGYQVQLMNFTICLY